VNKRFVRAAEGQAAGRLFFGSFLCAAQRNEQKELNILTGLQGELAQHIHPALQP